MATEIYVGGNKPAINLMPDGLIPPLSSSYYTSEIIDDEYVRLTATTSASSGRFYPLYKAISPTISGVSADTRQRIYVCAKVRGNVNNTGYPAFHIGVSQNGESMVWWANDSADGLSGVSLNDANWHTIHSIRQTYNSSSGNYYEYSYLAPGIMGAAVGDVMDVKEISVYSLTDTFGRDGKDNAITLDWCLTNLSNFQTKVELNNSPTVARKVKSMYIGANKPANNLLTNGRLADGTSGWTKNTNCSYQTIDNDCIRITSKITQGSSYPMYQLISPNIGGNTPDTQQIIYVCAKVRGVASNVSHPRVYLSCNTTSNGSTSNSLYDLNSIEGLADGSPLNDGKWHTMSNRLSTYVSDTHYRSWWRIGCALRTANTGDVMDVKEVALFNLTDIFGRGNEPSLSWCNDNLTKYAEKIEAEGSLSVARKIKKAYIGVNGIAQMCYNADE